MEGNLIYEGEFFNGKRNGKGKEYNTDEKIIFEGDYLNGEKWNGKGMDNDYLFDEFSGNGSSYEGRKYFVLNGEKTYQDIM